MKVALSLALTVVVALTLSFHAAYAIVSEPPAGLHYKEYPYNLMQVFFTIVCSALLITLGIHYYRAQWGRKSIITE